MERVWQRSGFLRHLPKTPRGAIVVALLAAGTLAVSGCVSSTPTPPASLPGIFAGLNEDEADAATADTPSLQQTNSDQQLTLTNGADTNAAPHADQQSTAALALGAADAAPEPSEQAASSVADGVPNARPTPDGNSDASPAADANAAVASNNDQQNTLNVPDPTAAPTEAGAPQQTAVASQSDTGAAAPAPAAVPEAATQPEVEKPSGGGFFSFLTRNQSGQTARRSSRDASGTTVTSRSSNSTSRKRSGPRPTARIPVGGSSSKSALPGVSITNLFGIDSHDDEQEEAREQIRMASVGTMARRGNFGLLLQRPDVQVGCFPPQLLRLLKRVERQFGRTPIVTSGYRSARKNRRVRGARKSTHVRCMAADIQVVGVSKWQLAKYLRSLPGRGGVGTYCHTKSVHIDVGKKRDWNWRCRRKRSRKS